MNVLSGLLLLVFLLNATLSDSKKVCRGKFNVCVNSICNCPAGTKSNKDKSCCVPICDNKCIGGKCVGRNRCKCLPGHNPTKIPFVCEPICSNCSNGYCYGFEKCAEHREERKIGISASFGDNQSRAYPISETTEKSSFSTINQKQPIVATIQKLSDSSEVELKTLSGIVDTTNYTTDVQTQKNNGDSFISEDEETTLSPSDLLDSRDGLFVISEKDALSQSIASPWSVYYYSNERTEENKENTYGFSNFMEQWKQVAIPLGIGLLLGALITGILVTRSVTKSKMSYNVLKE